MPIYTRTGDKGTTSLFDKTRVLKSHQRVCTYGTIDELNSMVGHAISQLSLSNRPLKKELEKIQNDLLDIGSALANPKALPIAGLGRRPKDFENLIDTWTKQMPDLTQFILPGGGKAGSLLHVCRTIARRSERELVSMMQKEDVDEAIVVYLNRLSDLFFTIARFVNYKEKKREIIWKKK